MSLINPRVDKHEGFRLLNARHATKAILQFSGGNDEGGVNDIKLFIEGKDEPVALMVYDEGEDVHRDYDPELRTWSERPFTDAERVDAELSRILCAPVEAEFGSWAGEFEAYGTLTWDVAVGTVVMDKDVQSGYDHSSSSW